MVRGQTIVIPVECHYKRKQRVHGEPIAPTWVPMTSTIGAFDLLHFSLSIMTKSCTSHRSSSVYQQGEAGFLEARVEVPLHPSLTLYVDSCVATLKPDLLSRPRYKFISNHGCMMDSLLPDSSSRFLLRDQANRLCFSFKMFNFNQTSPEQMFISCHLRATLKQKSPSRHNKACFFHKPKFRWRSIEGDSALCECCNTDCSGLAGVKNHGHPETDETFEARRTAGPLHVVHQAYWTGELSVS
ncbi:zona pellucida sperm-binding protein 3-like [Xiphophorus maculatus]|uniref:zona pellucida sperm-binding protein 3-like n=1 Tax=Xiphophorus maculatus TaxID=8083 RepID=UPI000C6E28B4|nr:zona pellucida sperm-binding protein 3-like [Xiphophorus maculatus]